MLSDMSDRLIRLYCRAGDAPKPPKLVGSDRSVVLEKPPRALVHVCSLRNGVPEEMGITGRLPRNPLCLVGHCKMSAIPHCPDAVIMVAPPQPSPARSAKGAARSRDPVAARPAGALRTCPYVGPSIPRLSCQIPLVGRQERHQRPAVLLDAYPNDLGIAHVSDDKSLAAK